jgi:hypothetical protein
MSTHRSSSGTSPTQAVPFLPGSTVIPRVPRAWGDAVQVHHPNRGMTGPPALRMIRQ